MAYLNKIMIIGNIGSDADVRTIQNSDRRVAAFNVATTKKFRDRNGEAHEDTQWHRVEYWLDPQSKLADYLKKGTPVFVEGEMTYRQYKDANNVDKTISSIRANTIQLVGGAPEGQKNGLNQQYNPQPNPSQGFQPAQQQSYRQQPAQQQGFQQTGQFPNQPVNQPIQPQGQVAPMPPANDPMYDNMPF